MIVDDVSLDLLNGAELDHVEELIGAYFQVNNPNAASSCGCGTFSIWAASALNGRLNDVSSVVAGHRFPATVEAKAPFSRSLPDCLAPPKARRHPDNRR